MGLATRKWDSVPRIGDISKAKLLKFDRYVGLEIEAFINNESLVAKALPKECGTCVDGSLHQTNGSEIQTPPASADKLEWYIDTVCDILKLGDSYVKTEAGLHIHLDGKDYVDNQTNTIRLTNTYFAIEPIILAILPQERRKNHFCMPLKARISDQEYRQMLRTGTRKDQYYVHKKWYKTQNIPTLERYKTTGKGDGVPRYYGFNLHALLALNHLELRYHAGTINKDKITNWVMLHLHILDWVVKNYSRRAIEKIRRATTLDEKFGIFCKYFEIPEHLTYYMAFRITKCSNKYYQEEFDDMAYDNSILNDGEKLNIALKEGLEQKINKFSL